MKAGSATISWPSNDIMLHIAAFLHALPWPHWPWIPTWNKILWLRITEKKAISRYKQWSHKKKNNNYSFFSRCAAGPKFGLARLKFDGEFKYGFGSVGSGQFRSSMMVHFPAILAEYSENILSGAWKWQTQKRLGIQKSCHELASKPSITMAYLKCTYKSTLVKLQARTYHTLSTWHSLLKMRARWWISVDFNAHHPLPPPLPPHPKICTF